MASNVIKAHTLQTLNRSVVIKREILWARQRGDEIVAQAERQKEQIIAEAQQWAEELLHAAQQKGYGSGLDQWNETLAAAWKSRDTYIAENEAALLKLAVHMAGKLVGEELRTAPETIGTMVREALRSARRGKSFTIQVHPADAPFLEKRMESLRAATGTMREVEISSNDLLSRGDCIIESDIGVIDARLETQLACLERALIGKSQT